MICEEEGRKSFYHGETSRTLYTRVKEHMHQGRDNNNETRHPLIKHNSIFHPGKDMNFNIKRTGSFKDPLSCQVNEGIRINNSTSDSGYLMNSKSEFHQGQVPRVIVVNGLN